MKRTSTFVLFLLWTIISFGQVPQGVSYQAVATNSDGVELRNQPIHIKATVRSASLNGPEEWIETHQTMTDDFGLFVIIIGQGVPEAGGNQLFFSDIKWGQSTYFLQMEIDPTGGNNFEFLGANQILSVPYALYSEHSDTAAVAMSVVGDNDSDASNELQELTFDENSNTISISNGNEIQINTDDADADPMNEMQSLTFDVNSNMLSIENGGGVDLSSLASQNSDEQNLTLNGTQLGIENGNTIDLAILQDGNEDADTDPTNEIQELTVNGSSIGLSNSTADIDLNNINFDKNDADADPTNEIQELTVNGSSIGLSNSTADIDLNNINFDKDDADADPMNEMQSLNFDPNTNELSISGGNAITIATDNADADADPMNEIQNLTLNGAMLGIENGNAIDLSILQDGVEDADANPNNELQNLNFNGTMLSIDNGNSVNLSALQDGVNDADADPVNEIQELSVNGSTISLSNSTLDVDLNSINFNKDDADADPMNEIQELSVNGSNIELSGTATNIDLNNIDFDKDDADADPMNELQELSVNGTNISLSGSAVDIDLNNIPINVNDADADPNNELQNLTTNGTSISMSGSNVSLDLNTIPFDKDDADADPMNEMQTLSYDDGTLTITGGNAINFSDSNFGAPTAEGNFPAGIFGNPVLLQMGAYTVPVGQTLYILGGPATLKIQTNSGLRTHSLAPFMPIFPEGTVIEDCMCVGSLVDNSPDLEAVVIDFVETPVYTVPADKFFFMKSGIVHDNAGTMNINNMEMEFMRPNFLSWSRFLYFDEGVELRNPAPATFAGQTLVFTGYLIDK